MGEEPLFWYFPIATAMISMIAFTMFSAPLTWIAYKQPQWAEKYRIQEKVGQSTRIIIPSIRYYELNGFIFVAILVLTWPLLRLTSIHMGTLPAWYVILLQVLFFIYFEDFLFYCIPNFYTSIFTRFITE